MLGKFRLRTIFIVPFVLQIGITISLVAWFAWHAGHHVVEELSQRLCHETSLRVGEQLKTMLQAPQQLNHGNVDAFKLGLFDHAGPDAIRHYFQRQLLAQKGLTLVGLGTERPYYVDLARLDDSQYLKLALVDPAKGPTTNWKVNLQGEIVGPIATDPRYDHRQRPWYRTAVARGQAGWSDIYVTKTPVRLVVSATEPWYDAQQHLQGVAVSSLSLSGISDFLRSLKVGKTGQSFIMENNGALVATSTGETPFLVQADKPVRLLATDSGNRLTRDTSLFLRQRFPDPGALTDVYNLDFMQDQQRHFVEVRPFRDGQGLSWTIVVVIPETDFIQDIKASIRINRRLCALAVLLAIVIGMLTSRWVTGPILALHGTASKILGGDLTQRVTVRRTDELGELALMFNNMTARLQDHLATLEKRVEERTAQLELANSTLEQRVAERTAELARVMSHLAQTEKMATLGGMVAGITHELNSPLGNLRLAAAGLAEEVGKLAENVRLGHVSRTALDKFLVYTKATTALIDRASERSAMLIESFKQVAVDQASERRYRFDLRTIIEHTVHSLGPSLKLTPYTIEIEVPTGIELDSYPGPLEQIITNLVNNSLLHAFAERDHGTMYIRARTLGDDLELVFGDDGVGMSEDICQRIFDPFFTTKAGKGGSGLGMYTIYNLITGLFGGTITIDGRPGLGAQFTLLFPKVCAAPLRDGE